ncbi:MAG: DNA polymerase III subunit delta [Bradymonadia bacterium]
MSSQWSKTLDGGNQPIYLLHGEEPFLMRQAAQWLKETVLTGAVEDFNFDRFDARESVKAARVIEAARTLPMMAPRRLVRVIHAEVMLTDRNAAQAEVLLSYLKDPDPSSCLVLQAHSKIKKNTKVYKAIAKTGCVYEAKTPYERELPGWLAQQARRRGRVLRPDAASLMVDAVGRDLSGLDSALERLCLYVSEPDAIELKHVEDSVAHTRTRTIWELVDAIAARNAGQALAQAHELLSQGENPLGLLAMITRQVRQLIIGRSVRARGADAKAVAQAAGVPPFRAQSFMRQLDRYRGDELLWALNRLTAADQALKRSKVPSDLLFESALLDLCAGRQV